MARLFRRGTRLAVLQSAFFINTAGCGTGTYDAFLVPAYGKVEVIGWAIGTFYGRWYDGRLAYRLRDHLCAKETATGKIGTGWPVLVLVQR